ncbi:efflux RND transporter periplasmic adaptor subunit [Sphingosinicella microcystinivorans]|uniref:efflux RND transporter periplasmic adaptor subunit n=1 Tax=Sphingosinicella microcystinivorans TaxID=335406 RepID=UPI0022F3F93F|nr:efflux RND transporter periplasmic adaptor subunit [Sphingosinicella microcystinivorans]WBX83108.1 efflux RND transporter periplasmic adaptor subunit [Sphingosinicella microcystinivorans]
MHQPVDSSFRSSVSRSWASAGSDGGRRRVLIVAAILVAAAVAAWLVFGGGAETPAENPEAGRPSITVIVPGTTQVADSVRAVGSIAARRDMPVGVQGEGGAVTAVLVDAGDYAQKGQVLARIDRSVLEQQVSQLQASVIRARADAALAQSELDRAQSLVARGFISKADIERRTATRDGANAAVNVAAAQLREAQARLGRLDIRAPEAGLILERNVEPGQVVSSGSPAVFRMAQNGAMEMRALVAEQDLAGIEVGQSATVQLIGSATEYAGRVWMVEPVINPQTRQGLVRIALSGDRSLRPGGFASGRIEVGTADRPLLPESAVMGDAESSYVYVVAEDGTVERRDVKVGTVSSAGVAISGGLSGKEQVVMSAGAFLNPGEKVSPVLHKPQK